MKANYITGAVIFLLIHLAMAFGVSGCGKDDSGAAEGAQAVKEEAKKWSLDGTFETPCFIDNGMALSAKAVISGESYVHTLTNYSDTECKSPYMTATYTKTLKISDHLEGFTYAVYLIYDKVEVMYHVIKFDETIAPPYGKTGWKAGVAQDVSGYTISGKTPGFPKSGEAFYQTMAFDGTELSLEWSPWLLRTEELNGTTPEKRITKKIEQPLTLKK